MNKHYQNGYFLSHFIPPQSKVFALLITFMLKYLANATMKLFQKKCRKGLLLLLFSFLKNRGQVMREMWGQENSIPES